MVALRNLATWPESTLGKLFEMAFRQAAAAACRVGAPVAQPIRLGSPRRSFRSAAAPSLTNAFSILGVQPGVSEDKLKAAFREQALRHHPDRNPDDPEAAEKAFKAVNEAYARISSKLEQRRGPSASRGDPWDPWEGEYGLAFPSLFYEVFGVRKLYLEGTFEHVLRAACDVTTRNRAGSRSATRISS